MYQNAHMMKSRSRQPSERVIRPSLSPLTINLVFWFLFLMFAFCSAAGSAGPFQMSFVILLIWVPIAAKQVLAFFNSRYVIQNDLITAHIGLLSRRVVQVHAADIRSIAMKQGIFGRLLGYGDVVIFTAATSGAEIAMRAVPNPTEIVAALDARRYAAKLPTNQFLSGAVKF